MSTAPHRFVDRDMIMRYLPGLGVGHTYAHKITSHSSNAEYIREGSPIQDDGGEPGEEGNTTHNLIARDEDMGGDEPEVDKDQGPEEDWVDEGNGDHEERDGGEDEGYEESEDGDDYIDNESIWSETEGSQDSEEY